MGLPTDDEIWGRTETLYDSLPDSTLLEQAQQIVRNAEADRTTDLANLASIRTLASQFPATVSGISIEWVAQMYLEYVAGMEKYYAAVDALEALLPADPTYMPLLPESVRGATFLPFDTATYTVGAAAHNATVATGEAITWLDEQWEKGGIVTDLLELAGSIVLEPVDWALTARELYKDWKADGRFSPGNLVGAALTALPFIPNVLRYADEVLLTLRGLGNFDWDQMFRMGSQFLDYLSPNWRALLDMYFPRISERLGLTNYPYPRHLPPNLTAAEANSLESLVEAGLSDDQIRDYVLFISENEGLRPLLSSLNPQAVQIIVGLQTLPDLTTVLYIINRNPSRASRFINQLALHDSAGLVRLLTTPSMSPDIRQRVLEIRRMAPDEISQLGITIHPNLQVGRARNLITISDQPVPELENLNLNATYGLTRNTRDVQNWQFEYTATGKPDPNIAIYVNGTEFDWYRVEPNGEIILLDAKNINAGGYLDFSISSTATFGANEARAEGARRGLSETARRQNNIAIQNGVTIEWVVPPGQKDALNTWLDGEGIFNIRAVD